MLGRVLKEVKLPFPDDFFPEMELSPQLTDDFHRSATRSLQQTLEAERPVTRLHPSEQPDQWKLIGDRNGLRIYRERGFVKGNDVKVNVLGQLAGSLEDVLLGLYATTNGSLKTQRFIMHSDYLDAAVLHVIEEDPYSEDDTGFSFQFKGLQWMACAPSGKLVHKRDLCWYEELGRTRDSNGDEVGYLVMQSVRMDECPPFEQQGLTRSTAAVCYIFRSLPDNRVGVYMKGQHGVGGKSRTWSADTIMSEMWLGVASALNCAKAKRLSRLVSDKEMFITSAPSKACDICDSKLKMLKTNQNCKICGKNVCDRCRMTKMIYPSRNTGNFPCSYFFCKPCLSDAKEKLYGRTTARVSFHSEASSGRSGSNRSGSPRYVRNPSTGRPGRLAISPSSDPTGAVVPRQRVLSHDQVGSSTLPPSNYYTIRGCGALPSSPRGSTRSYNSGHTTASLNTPDVSHINDSIGSSSNIQIGHSFQPSIGRPSGRSVENRAAAFPQRVMRTGSIFRGRNPPPLPPATSSKFWSTRTQPSSTGQALGSKYMGNESVDSTYDVERNETYRGHGFISDNSDLSDEFSDEDETMGPTASTHRRQPINIYDADDADVIEVNQCPDYESDSSSEPEPVDVFEQDKLKYINSFCSNDVSTAINSGAGSAGATPSSTGSSEQENLMERLMQINMAAEATYLMAKYNSNIQESTSR